MSTLQVRDRSALMQAQEGEPREKSVAKNLLNIYALIALTPC